MNNARGFSTVEVLLAASVLALLATAVGGALIYSQQSRAVSADHDRATDIAEEGLDAARNIRDEGYALLADGTNGLSSSSSRWNFFSVEDMVDNRFLRSVRITALDANRKRIISSVSWNITPLRQGIVSLASRLVNWRRSGGKGQAPTLHGTFDLTTANSGNNVADGRSITVNGTTVYLGRDANAGNEFFVFNVATPSAPLLLGQLALAGNPNDLAATSSYVFVASSDNSQELQVINVSSSTLPTLAASFDLTAANSGNSGADGLAVAYGGGQYLYYLRGNSGGDEFYIFDVSTPTAPTLVSSVDLSGDPNEAVVSGNLVYIASSDNVSELQIVSVSNPLLPVVIGTLDLNSGSAGADGTAVAVGGSTVYLGRGGSTGAPEFYVIDVTTPAAPTLTATLDDGTVNMQSFDYSSAAALVFTVSADSSRNDYRALDVTTPASPSLLTVLNLANVPYQLVYSESLDKVFVASGDDDGELAVIAP